MYQKKLIVITAPSGSGKTTLVKYILGVCDYLAFSVSACTRKPRANEQQGKDYYFFDETYFKELIKQNAFVEWEMVYSGKYYGTLQSELEQIWDLGKIPLIDIDVKGALAIKQKYPEETLTIFIEAPSLEELKKRLISRGTETEHTLEERITKAAYELTFAHKFDKILINDDLMKASEELVEIIGGYIKQ